MAQPKIKDVALALTSVDATSLNGAVAGTDDTDLVQLVGIGILPVLDGSALTDLVVPYKGALVSSTATLAVPDSTYTIVAFADEEYDTDTIHDLVTNNSRLTVPVGVTKIRLHAGVSWETNSTGERRMKIRKNGDLTGGVNAQVGIPASDLIANTNQNLSNFSSAVITVVANDYFEVELWQDSTVSLNVTNISATEKPFFAMEIIE